MTQAATIMRRLADELGERGAFPSPHQLTELKAPQAGLTARKVEWLRAPWWRRPRRSPRTRPTTQDGSLRRHRRTPRSPRIGPFSAELILIRGAGAPDVLPRHEPRLARAARKAYGLSDDADLAPVAEAWRPYRSWVSLLLRLDNDA